MACKVRVQVLDTYHRAHSLQKRIVLLIAYLRCLPSMPFQHIDNRRKQNRDIRHSRLYSFAICQPYITILVIIGNVEGLSIGIRQPREHLKDEQIAHGLHLRTDDWVQIDNYLHLFF